MSPLYSITRAMASPRGQNEDELAKLGVKSRRRPVQVASVIGRVMEAPDDPDAVKEAVARRAMATPTSPAAQAAMYE